MSKKEYTVVHQVSHDNQAYAIGETIELEDGHAKALLDAGAIAKKGTKVEKPVPSAITNAGDAPPARKKGRRKAK